MKIHKTACLSQMNRFDKMKTKIKHKQQKKRNEMFLLVSLLIEWMNEWIKGLS